MYKPDHIKVLKILSRALPKRTAFKTKDIVEKAFKRYESADRRVRNAYRKLRAEGHIEIIRRGEYRLTTSGAALCRRLKNNGWDIASEAKRKPRKIRRKKAAKRVVSSTETLSF